MEQLLGAYFEKGFFGAIGLMCTAALGAVGLHAKQDREFRKAIHDKVDKNHIHVVENHPDIKAFDLLLKGMDDQFSNLNTRLDSMQKDIREVRGKK